MTAPEFSAPYGQNQGFISRYKRQFTSFCIERGNYLLIIFKKDINSKTPYSTHYFILRAKPI